MSNKKQIRQQTKFSIKKQKETVIVTLAKMITDFEKRNSQKIARFPLLIIKSLVTKSIFPGRREHRQSNDKSLCA